MPVQAAYLVCVIVVLTSIVLWEYERIQGDRKGGALAALLGILSSLAMAVIGNYLDDIWLLIGSFLAAAITGMMIAGTVAPIFFSKKPQKGIFDEDPEE